MLNELEKKASVYGDVCLRKQRRKRQKLLITELLLDYAKNSTLHGLRYISERGLDIFERVFWLITFVMSVIICVYLSTNVYIKWKYSPVIVTVSERLVSVGEVPFPSVTICPQTKSRASFYNFSDKYDKYSSLPFKNETNEELEMYADIAVVCNFQYENILNRKFTDANMVKHIELVAPNTTGWLCFWNDRYHACDEMFKKVYTAEGLCYNMNGLAAKEMFRDTVQKDYNYSERSRPSTGWSMDEGYSKKHFNYFPKRGKENPPTPDLEVIMTSSDKDNDVLCNGLNSGYKIYLQHPADFPQSSTYYYAALDNQVSSLAINFHVISADKGLKQIPSAIRQCHFSEARPLRYFKSYTAKNCRAECLSNYTFELCDCVGYYMPHDNSSQICAENSFSCMRFAHEYMSHHELQLELRESDDVDGCRCLPACKTVEYDAEILKTLFNIKPFMQRLQKGDDSFLNTTKFSKIEMYFKKPQFVSMRRSELFGVTDFLANIGGLLGLFLGFSFLSLVEIFYFLTLRIGCTLKRDFKEEKKNRVNSVKIEKYN